MNAQCFVDSSIIKDLENFIKELKKIFEVMNVANIDRIELASYHLNNVSRSWFN